MLSPALPSSLARVFVRKQAISASPRVADDSTNLCVIHLIQKEETAVQWIGRFGNSQHKFLRRLFKKVYRIRSAVGTDSLKTEAGASRKLHRSHFLYEPGVCNSI
jgi:hypothetical protein